MLYRVYVTVPIQSESFFAAFRLLRLSMGWGLHETKVYMEKTGGWYLPGRLLPIGVFSSIEIEKMRFVLETEFHDFDCYPTLDVYPVLGE